MHCLLVVNIFFTEEDSFAFAHVSERKADTLNIKLPSTLDRCLQNAAVYLNK